MDVLNMRCYNYIHTKISHGEVPTPRFMQLQGNVRTSSSSSAKPRQICRDSIISGDMCDSVRSENISYR